MVLKIKQLREENGMTQKELADRVGNVQRNVSNWEIGASEPDCETIVRLAEVFGVTLDELFGREELTIAKEMGNGLTLQSFVRDLDKNKLEALKNFLKAFCQ